MGTYHPRFEGHNSAIHLEMMRPILLTVTFLVHVLPKRALVDCNRDTGCPLLTVRRLDDDQRSRSPQENVSGFFLIAAFWCPWSSVLLLGGIKRETRHRVRGSRQRVKRRE